MHLSIRHLFDHCRKFEEKNSKSINQYIHSNDSRSTFNGKYQFSKIKLKLAELLHLQINYDTIFLEKSAQNKTTHEHITLTVNKKTKNIARANK